MDKALFEFIRIELYPLIREVLFDEDTSLHLSTIEHNKGAFRIGVPLNNSYFFFACFLMSKATATMMIKPFTMN